MIGRMATSAAAEALPRRLPEALGVFLRHGSPRCLVAGAALAAGARAALGPFSLLDLLPPLGLLLVWPVQEWLIHVCILHYRPVDVR